VPGTDTLRLLERGLEMAFYQQDSRQSPALMVSRQIILLGSSSVWSPLSLDDRDMFVLIFFAAFAIDAFNLIEHTLHTRLPFVDFTFGSIMRLFEQSLQTMSPQLRQ
jgi:hypothetical protein